MKTFKAWLNFEGARDSYVDLGMHEVHQLRKALTIAAWVRVIGQTEWAGIVCRFWDTNLDESGYCLALTGDHGVYFGLEAEARKEHMDYLPSGPNTLPIGEWHHVAGTYDGQEMALYIDGRKLAKRSFPAPSEVSYRVDCNLRFGIYLDNDDAYAFRGHLAEVRLFSRALGEAEIAGQMDARLTGQEADLVGYWPLDEGQGEVLHDLSPNARHGERRPLVTWQREPAPPEPVAAPPPELVAPAQPEPPPPVAPPPPEPPLSLRTSSGALDTHAVLAAVERLNRKGVIRLLEKFARELDLQAAAQTRVTADLGKLQSEVAALGEKIEQGAGQGKLDAIQQQLASIDRSARELDDGEREAVRELIEDGLKNRDLGTALAHGKVDVNGSTQSLAELLQRVCTRPQIAAIHLSYDASDIVGARLVLTDRTEAAFTCARVDRPDAGEIEYVFTSSDCGGLPAEFSMRLRRTSATLTFCGRSESIDEYDLVYQSNVVFDPFA
jgi:hypothetical protein